MKAKKVNIKSDMLWRVGVVFFAFTLFSLLIVGRIIYLNLFEAESLLEKSKSISYKDIEIMPIRGDIRSADGKLMATTVPKYEIRMDMKTSFITQELFDAKVDSLAYCLSNLFKNKSQAEYKKSLITARKQGNRYFLLRRNVNYPQLRALKSFPILRNGKYKGGLIVITKSKREKPFGLLAYRTVGFVIDDKKGNKKGYVGLERTFDKDLRGEKGVRSIRKLSGGRIMPIEELVEPIDGSDIITTIDIKFQDIVENALLKTVSKYSAEYGTAILMEVETGQIKAIANLKKNNKGGYSEKYNHAIGSSIEPGSTFKLASLIVALEDGVVDLSDSIDVEGGRKMYYDRLMKDEHETDGNLTVQEIFELSSNVGVSKIIVDNYKNDPRKYVERLYNMNLNVPTGIGIKGESQPLIKYPDDETWSGVTLPWMSIGYELRLAPIQVLSFYNAIANGGKMVKPYLVSEIQKHGKTIKKFDTEILNPSICSKSTLEKAQVMLRGVVERGTANNINMDDLHISGKTGTAQIAKLNSGYKGGGAKAYNVSFVGYFPSENPKYSCIVVLNDPKGLGKFGRTGSAPVFKKIAMQVYVLNPEMINKDKDDNTIRCIPYKFTGYNDDVTCILKFGQYSLGDNVSKSSWVTTSTKDKDILINSRYMTSVKVPDVRGLGLKDALFILENAGLFVKVYGKGKVCRQSLPVGANYTKGQRIVIELN